VPAARRDVNCKAFDGVCHPAGVRQLAAVTGSIMVVLVSAAVATAAAPAPAELLQLYEPVLLFHPDEDWAPEPVDAYLQRARVEKQTAKSVWTPVPPPLPTSNVGCASSPCYRLDLPCVLRAGDACYEQQAEHTNWSHPVVYGRVVAVPQSAPTPPGITQRPAFLVHYWLFYDFDDWHSPHGRLWQTHEGDWESITIGVDSAGAAIFAAYSEHCSGTVLPWAAVTKRAGTHPVAYVALGSHANWFSPAVSATRFTECLKGGLAGAAAAKAASLVRLAQDRIVDRMGTAHPLGPAGLAGVTPLEVVPLDPASAPWTHFPGRWGEGQILWLGSRPRSFTTVSQGYGPGTPNWNAVTVAASWHPAG
jgi:hypothetical protein